ncbi:MAG TPA: hypothetical protein VGE10_15200, partial [Zeimonas sp.]
MREAAPSALHNMSAPPRSVVDVRVLRAKRGSVARPADHDATPGGRTRPTAAARMPSGSFFARVHLVGLLHDGRAHEPCGRDI